MSLTTKQRAIMTVIIAGNPDGSFADIDEILDRLSYETTKQSLQFSLRALAAKGCIQKMPTEIRRKRSRVVYSATESGKEYFTAPKTEASESEFKTECDSILDAEISIPRLD